MSSLLVFRRCLPELTDIAHHPYSCGRSFRYSCKFKDFPGIIPGFLGFLCK